MPQSIKQQTVNGVFWSSVVFSYREYCRMSGLFELVYFCIFSFWLLLIFFFF